MTIAPAVSECLPEHCINRQKGRFENTISKVSSTPSGFQVNDEEGELPLERDFDLKLDQLVYVNLCERFLLKLGSRYHTSTLACHSL